MTSECVGPTGEGGGWLAERFSSAGGTQMRTDSRVPGSLGYTPRLLGSWHWMCLSEALTERGHWLKGREDRPTRGDWAGSKGPQPPAEPSRAPREERHIGLG